MTDVGFAVEAGFEVGLTVTNALDFAVEVDFDLAPVHTGKRWRLVAVDDNYQVVPGGWLSNAVFDPVTFEPCKAETFEFTLTQRDPKAALFAYSTETSATKYQLVQLWYGDQVVAYGPAVQPVWGDDGLVHIQCHGKAWIPTERRFVGPVERENMLRNGIFYGLDYWTPLVADNDAHTFVAQDTDTNITVQTTFPTIPLAGALRIEDRSPQEPDGHRLPYVAQDVRFNASHKAITVTLRARAYVDAFDGANLRRTGLVMVLLPVGYTDVWTDGLDFKTGGTIDENTPVGELIDLSCTMEIPWSGNERIVQARCEGCKGVIEYTDVWLEYTDSLRLAGDQAFVFGALFDHLSGNQSAPWLYSRVHPNSPWTHTGGYGKSDTNIDVDAPNTGVDIYRDYPFAQRGQGLALLNELAVKENGLEWSTRNTRNRCEVYTGHPKLGRYRADCRLTHVNGRGNLVTLPYQWLGDQGASSVTVTPPSGAWREGSAVDASVFDGLTLEEDMAAPVDVDRDNLDAVAARRLVATRNPASLSVTVPFDLWERGLRAGDRVPVHAVRGDLEVEGVWWVRRLTVQPGSRHMSADIVPWPYTSPI